jgi:hypothetical protein
LQYKLRERVITEGTWDHEAAGYVVPRRDRPVEARAGSTA